MTFVLGEATQQEKIDSRKLFLEENATLDLEKFHQLMLENKEKF